VLTPLALTLEYCAHVLTLLTLLRKRRPLRSDTGVSVVLGDTGKEEPRPSRVRTPSRRWMSPSRSGSSLSARSTL